MYFGDTQAGEPGYDFTEFEQLAVLAAGLPDAPGLAVFGGDMVDDGGDVEQWSQFLRAAAHDNTQSDSFYLFYMGGIHFIMLDSNIMGAANESDILWLDRDLQSGAAQKARRRAAVPGQFGPYWVRQVSKIVLYEQIPEKNIKNVWVFAALTEGITPYEYEYYGSKDSAIDLEQIFSRLDHVDSKSFFTMKSADGLKKDESMIMVKSRYYIKTDGADAPTNVAPYIKLGMNVQKIAWFSTNEDAAVFPYLLPEYMDTAEIRGQVGVPISEVLYEAGVKMVKTARFDLIGTAGERTRAEGEKLDGAILVPREDGSAGVVWEDGSGYADIENLLRIRLVED